MSTGFGIDSKPIYIALVMATHFAFLTPGACHAGLLFGNSGWISIKEIYKYLPIVLLLFFVVLITVGYNWFKLML